MGRLPFPSMNGGQSSGMQAGMASDADLVEACVSGDQAAFAQLYDRYSDRVFSFCLTLTRDRGLAEDAMADTFVTAWQRMSQLRDGSQVRSWLFAIAKNRVSRLGVKAARQVAVDPTGVEMRNAFDLDESSPDLDVADAMSGDAAVALVWEAAEGLNENERAVLELSVRQGVEGDELASALGVSRHNANVIASRMRQNLERSIGALVLIRYNDDGCSEFSKLVAGFSGALTPLWRKRISRHADVCEICSKKRMPKALALFGESPVSAAPISARSQILASLPVTPEGLPLLDTSAFRAGRNGFPAGGGAVRRILVGLGVAAVAIAILTMATIQFTGEGRDAREADLATVATPGGTMSEVTAPAVTETDISSTTTSQRFEAVAGGVVPGMSERPADVPEGPSTGPSTVPSTSSSTVSPRDTAAPKITSVTLSAKSLVARRLQFPCLSAGSQSAVLTVTTNDNVGVVAGEATVQIGGVETPLLLSLSGTTLTATVGPFNQTGSYRIVRLSVVDAAGNRSAMWSTLYLDVVC